MTTSVIRDGDEKEEHIMIAKTRFIYIADNILIREEWNDGIYEYYLGDDFIFGVEKRFTGNELRILHMNGYFDMWLYKEEA